MNVVINNGMRSFPFKIVHFSSLADNLRSRVDIKETNIIPSLNVAKYPKASRSYLRINIVH